MPNMFTPEIDQPLCGLGTEKNLCVVIGQTGAENVSTQKDAWVSLKIYLLSLSNDVPSTPPGRGLWTIPGNIPQGCARHTSS